MKSVYSTHETPETRKLYDLFAEYGGPVQVALELYKEAECKNAKVYQVCTCRCQADFFYVVRKSDLSGSLVSRAYTTTCDAGYDL